MSDITFDSSAADLWDKDGMIFNEAEQALLKERGTTAGIIVGYQRPMEVRVLALTLGIPAEEMQKKIGRVQALLPPTDIARTDQESEAIRDKIRREKPGGRDVF